MPYPRVRVCLCSILVSARGSISSTPLPKRIGHSRELSLSLSLVRSEEGAQRQWARVYSDGKQTASAAASRYRLLRRRLRRLREQQVEKRVRVNVRHYLRSTHCTVPTRGSLRSLSRCASVVRLLCVLSWVGKKVTGGGARTSSHRCLGALPSVDLR